MNIEYLTVRPYPEVSASELMYYVKTPEGETLDFESKKSAQEFIEFYKQYKQKHPERF